MGPRACPRIAKRGCTMTSPARPPRKRPDPSSAVPIGGAAEAIDPGGRERAVWHLKRAARWLAAFRPVGEEHRFPGRTGAPFDGIVIRVDWPGTLKVFGADGTLLARSAPGRPEELANDFVPPRSDYL